MTKSFEVDKTSKLHAPRKRRKEEEGRRRKEIMFKFTAVVNLCFGKKGLYLLIVIGSSAAFVVIVFTAFVFTMVIEVG